jgi:ATP-binding cassette, subfamily B, bacterial
MKSFPFTKQLDSIDCGPACIKMISKFHGKDYSLDFLREKCSLSNQGVSISGIAMAAEYIGFRTYSSKITIGSLKNHAPLPCVAYWEKKHFIVVYEIKNDFVYVADPNLGLIKYKISDFTKGWAEDDRKDTGIALLLEPTEQFFIANHEDTSGTSAIKYLVPLFKKHRLLLFQLLIGLFVTSAIQLCFPFLTQAIVDYGIKIKDIHFIYLIIVAQVVLLFSQIFAEIIRGWLLLHLGARVSISIISEFIRKLTDLPISFFENRKNGDILQRIEDNKRVESFLTSSSLSIVFSLFNFLTFGIVLLIYNSLIFMTFVLGALLYFFWIFIFLKRRITIDQMRFAESSNNTSNLVQLITGIQEIKLNNSEDKRRWEWQDIQVKIFNISRMGLRINQYQLSGATVINELKNILIAFIAATSVLTGEMTLGMMIAVQYMVGQLNGPMFGIISFVRAWQDTMISLNRLSEV